jgi:hypothetical protein
MTGIWRCVEKMATVLLKVLLVLAVPVLLDMAVELLVAPGSSTAEARCRAAAATLVKGGDRVLSITDWVVIHLVTILLLITERAVHGVASGVGCKRAIIGTPALPAANLAASTLLCLVVWLLLAGAPCRYFAVDAPHEAT